MNGSRSPHGAREDLPWGKLAFLTLHALSCSLEVFFHLPSTFGSRYFGLQAALAGLIMLFLPALASEPDPGPMWSFLTLFLVACAIARASSFAKRLRHGDSEHSYYTGRPAFAGLLRRIGEERVKGVIEPIIAMLAGTVMLEFNSTLGGYWLAAGLALAITVQMQLFRDRRRAMDMRDAYFDQQRVARRWRDQLQ